MIEIEGLKKKFGHNEVLKGINIHVEKGEIISILKVLFSLNHLALRLR